MDKPTILSCLKGNPNVTLVKLCELLGIDGNTSEIGQTGYLIGQMLRDKMVGRDEKKWVYWTKESSRLA